MSVAKTRLSVRGLSRKFGDKWVVRDVDLDIEPGHVTCLLGPSGCGKSTTLRMIAGVERPDQGEVAIDGNVVCKPTASLPPERRAVGLMFQDFALFPHMSVAQNVGFGLRDRQRAPKRVADLLAKMSLSHLMESYPHALSGGEQQRVALARALAPRPKVMLMDEPFSGLDNRLRDGIRDETLDVLRDEDTAVLLVTHEPDEAMRMADQILLMREGRIVQSGAPYTVFHAPIDKASAAFFSDINVIPGVVQGALCDTPFGQFLTPGHPDGTRVEIVIRPNHLRIDFDRSGRGPNPTAQDGTPARGTVIRARFVGRESLVEFAMDHGDQIISAAVPGVFVPSAGTVMWLMVRRDKCFVFPIDV